MLPKANPTHRHVACSNSRSRFDEFAPFQKAMLGDAMIVKKGEVITIASGAFEGYDRAGPFIVTQDVDLEAFIVDARALLQEPWELNALLLSDAPRILC